MPPETAPLEKPSPTSGPEAESTEPTKGEAPDAAPSAIPEGETKPDAVDPDDQPTLLEQIKQAPKYRPIIERGDTPEEKAALRQRAQVLEKALLGKDQSDDTKTIRGAIARYGTAAALAASHQHQETGKKLIPERFYQDKALQKEVFLASERIKAGEGIDVLLKEAYQAGKNNKMQPLRALKMLGTMVLQENAFDLDKKEEMVWPDEAQSRLIRFAEIINAGVLMNTALLRINKDTLPPDVARYIRTNLAAFGQNEDIPDFLKKDLQKITARLGVYEKTKDAAEGAVDTSPSVLDEPATPPLAGDTTIARGDPTTIEASPIVPTGVVETPIQSPDRLPILPAAAEKTHELPPAVLAQRLALLQERASAARQAPPSDVHRRAQETVDTLFSIDVSAFAPYHVRLISELANEGQVKDPARERRRQRYVEILDNEISFDQRQNQGWLSRFLGERAERYFARVNVATNPGRLLPFFGKESWRQVIEARTDTIDSLRALAQKAAERDPGAAALWEALADRFALLNVREAMRYQQPAWRRFFGRPIARQEAVSTLPLPTTSSTPSPVSSKQVPTENLSPELAGAPPAPTEPPPPIPASPSVVPSANVSELARAIQEAAAELKKKPTIPPGMARRWASEHEQE